MLAITEESPDEDSLQELLTETRHTKQLTTTIHARVEVLYTGKNATAELATGDRLLIIKPDGSIVVHTATGCNATNWMTDGATITVTPTEDSVTLTATQTNPEQTLQITIDDVHYVTAMQMDTDANLSLQGTEKDMQKHVADNPELIEQGLRVREREHPTPAGPIDIWGRDTTGTPTAIELKRRQISPDNVEQLNRYMKHLPNKTRGFLVAPSISSKADALREDYGYEFVAVEPPGGAGDTNTSLTDFTE